MGSIAKMPPSIAIFDKLPDAVFNHIMVNFVGNPIEINNTLIALNKPPKYTAFDISAGNAAEWIKATGDVSHIPPDTTEFAYCMWYHINRRDTSRLLKIIIIQNKPELYEWLISIDPFNMISSLLVYSTVLNIKSDNCLYSIICIESSDLNSNTIYENKQLKICKKYYVTTNQRIRLIKLYYRSIQFYILKFNFKSASRYLYSEKGVDYRLLTKLTCIVFTRLGNTDLRHKLCKKYKKYLGDILITGLIDYQCIVDLTITPYSYYRFASYMIL